MPETNGRRKETIIWPPHKPIYTFGAAFLAVILTGLFVYLRFAFVLTPLQQFDLPIYIKAAIVESIRRSGKYQLLLMADKKGHALYARDVDVAAGSTPQASAQPIPLVLSDSARQSGIIHLYRSVPTVYQNSSLVGYFRQQVYDGATIVGLFQWPLIFGVIALIAQLPISIRKDIRRRKEMKYGRRLKGPVFVTPKQFNKAIQGTGIGLKVHHCREMLRVPLRAEDQHFEIIGDTGSGKSITIFSYGPILFPSGIPKLFCCFLPRRGSFSRCRRLPISAPRRLNSVLRRRSTSPASSGCPERGDEFHSGRRKVAHHSICTQQTDH